MYHILQWLVAYLSGALRSLPPAAPLSTLAQVSTMACRASACPVWAASPFTTFCAAALLTETV